MSEDAIMVLIFGSMPGVPMLIMAYVMVADAIRDSCWYRTNGVPRGFRWITPTWQVIKSALRWAMLRIFYPERLAPKKTPPPEVVPSEVLEIWHMAFELNHSPDECDRIANLPVLHDDTRRRHAVMTNRETSS